MKWRWFGNILAPVSKPVFMKANQTSSVKINLDEVQNLTSVGFLTGFNENKTDFVC
jgi:hypothetical protein